MTKTISTLWESIIFPERPLQIRETKMRRARYLLEQSREELMKSLSEEEKEKFNSYWECREDYGLLLNEQAFGDGFSLGLRLAAEAFMCENSATSDA